MTHEQFMNFCKRQVARIERDRKDVADTVCTIEKDDVFCVWSCKTLQNSKCLMSARHKGAYYYEFTMNGDKHEIYMDVYKKEKNVALDESGKEILNRVR
ncbi:DUF6275 family protein [Fusobacterium necrophorum subsp. funduliforme]